METKHTKEYATKLSKEITTNVVHFHSFVEGYMEAIKQTAAPELLEALKECLDGVKELNGEYQSGWDETIYKAINAIKKATE